MIINDNSYPNEYSNLFALSFESFHRPISLRDERGALGENQGLLPITSTHCLEIQLHYHGRPELFCATITLLMTRNQQEAARFGNSEFCGGASA
jgi:hypothetical protein